MPKFIASVAHRDTGKDEYLIRHAASERELRDALSDEGLVVRSLRPADFGGKGARFEIRTSKGRVAGPFGPDMLRAMVRDGNLTPHCSIRKTGDLDTHAWLPAWKAKGLFPGHVVDSIRRSHEVVEGDDDQTAKLKALKRLLDDGVIDEQDYKFRKGELLGTPYVIDETNAIPERPVPLPVASTAFRRESQRQFDEATVDEQSHTKAPAIALAVLFLGVAISIGVWVGTASETSPQSTDPAIEPSDARHQIITLQQDFDQEFQRVSDQVAENMMRINELRAASLDNEQPDLHILERLHGIWTSTSSTLRDGKQALDRIDHRIRNEVSKIDSPQEFDGLNRSRNNSLQQLIRHIATADNEISSTEDVILHARELQRVLQHQQQAASRQSSSIHRKSTHALSRTTLTSSNIGRYSVPMLALADCRGTVYPSDVFESARLDNAFRSTIRSQSTDVQRRWVGDGNMGMVWIYKAALCFEPELFAFEDGKPALAFAGGFNLRAVMLYENTSSDYASLSTDSYLVLVQFQMRASSSEAARFVRHVNEGGSVRMDWHFIGSTDDSLTRRRKPDSKIENRAELVAEIESYELVD